MFKITESQLMNRTIASKLCPIFFFLFILNLENGEDLKLLLNISLSYDGGSVAEWSACQTRNPVVPGSSPALATS